MKNKNEKVIIVSLIHMILILVKYFVPRFLDEENGNHGTAIGNLRFYFSHIANGVSSLRNKDVYNSVD